MPSDREGERQSTFHSKPKAKGKSVPKAASTESRRETKKSKSPKQVKFASDEFDLGDHATNNDKASEKPNYAKQHMQDKQKAKKLVEPANDDCGDDLKAIDSDDGESFAAFVDDQSTACPDSDSDSLSSFHIEESEKFRKVYLSSLDELFLFSDLIKSKNPEIERKVQSFASVPSEADTLSFEHADTVGEPFCSHFFKAPAPTPVHVMEMFGGYAGVTRIALKRSMKVGKCFDINVGVDLTQPGEKEKLMRYISQYKPTCIIMGPPCTSFSSWARFNKVHYPTAWARSYAIGLPLAQLSAEIAQMQIKGNRFFLIENPWHSAIWELPCFKALLPSCHIAYCEQCMFDLKDMSGAPTLKPTAFVSNSEKLVEGLRVSCNGSHESHAPLAGKIKGISKTKFAQRWPPKLCKTIVDGVQKVCFGSKFHSTSYLKQVYAGDAAAKPTCPGCRNHAYRRDPRHTRVQGVCRFPDDTSDVLNCPACKRNLPSHHPLHNQKLGECHWSEAMPRLSGGSSSSRGPQPTANIKPDAELKDPAASRPPQCNLGSWVKTFDSYLVDILNAIADRDGWHELADGSKALVMTNTRFVREPQPRFDSATYNLRSTFGRFVEHPHDAGVWWQVEESVEYRGKERHIGFPVECLIHVFEPGIASVSPTENKIRSSSEAPPTFGEPPPLKSVRRRVIQPEPEIGAPREIEHGDAEPEVPEISAGRQIALREEPTITAEEQALAKAEQAEEEQAIAKAEQIDWSAIDLGTALRELKSENKSLVTRALRKLHLRWYHAPPTRMKAILARVGVPTDTLQLVQTVCDTCRICRAWKRPTAKAIGHLNQAEEFNHRVQTDLLFVGDYIILHMCDEATRFSVAEVIQSKEPSEILKAMKHSWIKYFGPPKLFVSDSEGALSSEEAGIWAERLGTSFKLLPRYSHATTVERHHETLRQLVHKIAAQCKAEKLIISMDDIVAESTVAKNSMLTINGYTPYTAVLGRNPNLLGEFEHPSVSAVVDHTGGSLSKHSSRLREIAVTSMVETSAAERVKRAQASQTRISSEQLELQANDLVDICRTPRTKDNIGWRGPCKVLSVEDGQINVQWNGRVICCRAQDVRKAMMYPLMLRERSEDTAFDMVRVYANNLVNTAETFGIIYTEHGWELSTAARKTPKLFYALLRIAHDMFAFPRCVAAKVGKGVANTNGLISTVFSVIVWWPSSTPQLYRSMSCSAQANLNLRELFGENWRECCWVRFFGVSETDARLVRRIAPDVPYLGDRPDPEDLPDAPAEPVPMDEEDDDVHIDDNQSMATTRLAPDTNDNGPPPHPPHPQGPLRQRDRQVHSNRSRSTRNAPSPPNSEPGIAPPAPPPLGTPPPRSNRSLSSIGSLRSNNSPRGDKRAPTTTNSSDPSLRHTTKQSRHETPSSGSRDPMPAPQVPLHEPLLPILDDNEDDPDLDDDIADDATIAQSDSSDVNALFVKLEDFVFAASTTQASDLRTAQTVETTWDDMYRSGKPPPQYHAWKLHPGLDELVGSQQHYLANCTVCSQHCEIRQSSTKDDVFEVEIGPSMAVWFADAPKIAADEILVFKATSDVSSAQIEKNFDALTPQEIKVHHELVEKAIRKEIASFVDHKTFARALRSSCKNICTSRWVLRWKEIDGVKTVKARLTIRGFQDLAEVPSYASTASRWAQRLVVSLAVQKSWKLWVTDISTAFLQGMSFTELAKLTGSEVRDVAFVPPKGFEKYFTELKGLHDLNFSTEVLKLLKAAYGLRDAPRAWRIRLDAELRKLGGIPLLTDKALYCFYGKNEELEALLSTHVDDIKGAGTDIRVAAILAGLEKAFGKLKTQFGSFLHCGLMHELTKDGYEVHQTHYAAQLRCVDVSSLNLAELDKLLEAQFVSAYLSLLGGLSWLIQTRTDIAIYVVALQRAASRATTGHLLKLNKLTKWVRRKVFKLTYRKLQSPCKLVTISDSAFRTEPDSNLAMRGCIIGICEDRKDNRGGKLHVLEFFARKQRRVCRSTFAAELNAIADALETTRLINLTIACCHKPVTNTTSLQKLEDNGELPLQIEVFTDCRSVYDALVSEDTKTPSESSLVLILHMIKELMVAHVVKHLTWVDTDDMLADGLTKGGVSRKPLFELATSGSWFLKKECKTHFEQHKRAIGSTFLLSRLRQTTSGFLCMMSEVVAASFQV